MFETVFGFIWCFVFFGILALFVYALVSAIRREANNNRQPVRKVDAQAVAKRINVSGDNSYTTYYVTFELVNGERMELVTEGELYGMIVEGDYGSLTYQGYKCLDFIRVK